MKRIELDSLRVTNIFPPYPVGSGLLAAEGESCLLPQRSSKPSPGSRDPTTDHTGCMNGTSSTPPYLFATPYAIGPPTSERPRTRS
jgi:hypothetical protein